MSNSPDTTSGGGGGGGGGRSAEEKSGTKSTASDRKTRSSPKRGEAAPSPPRKTDWHARAVAAFAAGRYDEAAATWSHALAETEITLCRGTELERILYLQRRGEAYVRAGFPTLALDDFGWVLHMKGFGYSPNVDLPGRTRLLRRGLAACTAYFDACVDAYAECRVAAARFAASVASASSSSSSSSSSTPSPSTATASATVRNGFATPFWLEAYAYLESPTRHIQMYERLMDDLAAYARALDEFGNHERAFIVYADLAYADRRTPDSPLVWLRHALTTMRKAAAAAAAAESTDGKSSRPEIVNASHNLSAKQRKELERRVTQKGVNAPIDRVHETWRLYDEVTRRATPASEAKREQPTGAKAAEAAADEAVVEWRLGDRTDAKPTIECRRTRTFGRGMYACRDYKRGDVVWSESPTYSANVDVASCVACARRAPNRAYACAAESARDVTGTAAAPCDALYCSDRCRRADRPTHRMLCGLRLAPIQTRIAEISFSTSGRTPLVVLHMLARVASQHSPALAKLVGTQYDRVAHDGKRSATVVIATATAVATFPPVASFGDAAGGGGGGGGDAAVGNAHETMALRAMSDEPWLRNWIANVTEILAAEEAARTPTTGYMPRANLYAQYERLRDEFLPHAFVHPQIFNMSNFYLCMRFLILYSFAYPTAALNGQPDEPYPNDAPEDATPSLPTPPAPKQRNAVPAGVAIHKVASCFNHSCEPNLDWTYSPFVRNQIIVRAARDVRAGEQLFISYINHDQPYQRRQDALMSYQFVCTCRKCVARK